MKVKVSPRLKPLLSKHFVQRLPNVSIPVALSLEQFHAYWEKCPMSLKRNSLVFFSKELIDLVNKTNSRLLYCDLLSKKQQNQGSNNSGENGASGHLISQDYQLLNAFEMLWNIENTTTSDLKVGGKKIVDVNQGSSSDNLDLVQILSHTDVDSNNSGNGTQFGSSKVQGHALTIKDEFISSLLDICTQSSQGSFLDCSHEKAFLLSLDTNEKLFIVEEELFVKSIDTSLIKNWEDFEYVLSVIIENRLLQLYQGHLDREYQRKWKKLDQELLCYQEEVPKNVMTKKKGKSNTKNKKKKKQAKKVPNKAAENILEIFSQKPEVLDKMQEQVIAFLNFKCSIRIQRHVRSFLQRIKAINDSQNFLSHDSTERDQSADAGHCHHFTESSGDKEEHKRLFLSQKKRRLDNYSSQTPPRTQKVNLKFGSTHTLTTTASLIEYKKEDFNLDFNSAANSSSDKSTTDNFQSDEDHQLHRVRSKMRSQNSSKNVNQVKELEHQKSRGAQSQKNDGKFYWYLPQMFNLNGTTNLSTKQLKKKKVLEEIEDVSSESSDSDEESSDIALEGYLQTCYYNSYLYYEQEARQRNYMLDVFNYNPNHLWQNIYLHNQQMEQILQLNFGNILQSQMPYSYQQQQQYPNYNQAQMYHNQQQNVPQKYQHYQQQQIKNGSDFQMMMQQSSQFLQDQQLPQSFYNGLQPPPMRNNQGGQYIPKQVATHQVVPNKSILVSPAQPQQSQTQNKPDMHGFTQA